MFTPSQPTLERTVKEIAELESQIENFLNAEDEKEAGFDPLAEAEKEYGDGEDYDLQTGIEAGENQFYPFEHLDLDAWLADLQNDRSQLDKILQNREQHYTRTRCQIGATQAADCHQGTEPQKKTEMGKIIVKSLSLLLLPILLTIFIIICTNGQPRR